MKTRMSLAAAILCCSCASLVPMVAGADSREVWREIREGARSVELEKREAAREMRRCKTRDCVLREAREGKREVKRERREARNEIRRGRAEYYSPPVRYDRNARYYDGGRYYDSNPNSNSNYNYNFNDRDAHYHPGGQYCRDGRHIVHLRDNYYRGDRRWYRDGRYWNEYDYVSQYYDYGGQNRYRDDDGNDDLMRGIVIGAAVVGVIAAIHEANDND